MRNWKTGEDSNAEKQNSNMEKAGKRSRSHRLQETRK
jgi:hypothetical protein